MVGKPISGQRLGPYELLRPLGKGASGQVWEASLHGPGGFQKPVALKLLRRPDDEGKRADLLREARIGARLQHPNVVSTLLVGEHDGVLCLALELVRGWTVGQLMVSHGVLPARAVADVGEQAARALHHIHTFEHRGARMGLVHRDVKPANLLVDRGGTVKLADLGISMGLREAGEAAGTPGYAPPEQIDRAAEPRSDLFALGATLYLMATAKRAFGRGQAALLTVSQVRDRLDDPAMWAPLREQAPALEDLVRACLGPDPRQRPGTAEEVRQALADLKRQMGGKGLRQLLNAEPGNSPDPTPSKGTSQAETLLLPAGNLHPPRNAFLGRQAELSRVVDAVGQHRWVVLMGPGGMGKTRLALEVARTVQAQLPGGGWAIDLTEARSVDGVCAAVGRGLGATVEADDPVEGLGLLLQEKGRCVVVLDNLEQCVDALPATLGRWLQIAPLASFLGTSRQLPGLQGEKVVDLAGLAPDDAVALFEERASGPLSAAHRAQVPDLCHALDCMPLPIELAAARTRLLAVPDIVARLSPAMLAGGGRDRPERHRSVRASLRWSWDLLSETAQDAMAQLSVFEGGFDLAAAEAVLEVGDAWVLDTLQELADASLLRADLQSGRFGAWMVVRTFARDQLLPDARREAELRHGSHYASFSKRDAENHPQELDNLVAACRRAVARGDEAIGAQTMQAAYQIFHARGPVQGAEPLIHEALACTSADSEPRGQAEATLAQYLLSRGRRPEGLAATRRALAAFRVAGSHRVWGPLHTLAQQAEMEGDFDTAEQLMEEALGHARADGDVRAESILEGSMAKLCNVRGDPAGAEERYLRSLQLARDAGALIPEGTTLSNLAVTSALQGRLEEAIERYQQALPVMQQQNHVRAVLIVSSNLGELLRFAGRGDEADLWIDRGLAMAREYGNTTSIAATLFRKADRLLDLGRLEEAEAHAREAYDLAQQGEDRSARSLSSITLARCLAARGQLADAIRILVPPEEVHPFTRAKVEAVWAELWAQSGDLDAARTLLEAARRRGTPSVGTQHAIQRAQGLLDAAS